MPIITSYSFTFEHGGENFGHSHNVTDIMSVKYSSDVKRDAALGPRRKYEVFFQDSLKLMSSARSVMRNPLLIEKFSCLTRFISSKNLREFVTLSSKQTFNDANFWK